MPMLASLRQLMAAEDPEPMPGRPRMAVREHPGPPVVRNPRRAAMPRLPEGIRAEGPPA